MLRNVIIVQVLVLIWQIFVPCIVRGSRSYGCMEGYCAMDNCRNAPGNQQSTYCYIAADSAGNYLRCGGRGDCRGAAQSWGNCKAFSCFANRAPSPSRSRSKTCESMNAKKVRELNEGCRSFSFEKWTRDYDKPGKIVKKFEPCVGSLIEDEAKKVIKYCFCYNSCGKDQADSDACTFTGLDRRLDFEATTASTYAAICAIDCEPTDKYILLATLKHNKPNKASIKVRITKGTLSSRTTSSGGSTSFTVSAELGASILEIFSAKLGLSATTGFNWSNSSSSTSVEEVQHEVSVEVNPGDEVLVYQVVGECENSDGTKYTLKTGRYETKGKAGEILGTSEIPPEEGSKWT